MKLLLFLPVFIGSTLIFVFKRIIIEKLFPLLFILVSVSFSQEPINYETTLIGRDGLLYSKDTNKPYSGPVFSLYDDGKKKEEGSLKD